MQTEVTVRIAGRRLHLEADQLIEALESALPEPVRDHFVVIAGRRFPPKQALSVALGLDRADFTTHQARSILRRLGFTVARRSTEASLVAEPATGDGPHGGRMAEVLRPHIGKWVALKGTEVLVAADTFDDVVSWLERFDRFADMVFRVPSTPEEVDLSLAG